MIKVGDKIRVLVDGLQYARVKKGDILHVNGVYPYFIRCQNNDDESGFDKDQLGQGFELLVQVPQSYGSLPGLSYGNIEQFAAKLNGAPISTSNHTTRHKCKCEWTTVYQKGCQCNGI